MGTKKEVATLTNTKKQTAGGNSSQQSSQNQARQMDIEQLTKFKAELIKRMQQFSSDVKNYYRKPLPSTSNQTPGKINY